MKKDIEDTIVCIVHAALSCITENKGWDIICPTLSAFNLISNTTLTQDSLNNFMNMIANREEIDNELGYTIYALCTSTVYHELVGRSKRNKTTDVEVEDILNIVALNIVGPVYIADKDVVKCMGGVCDTISYIVDNHYDLSTPDVKYQRFIDKWTKWVNENCELIFNGDSTPTDREYMLTVTPTPFTEIKEWELYNKLGLSIETFNTKYNISFALQILDIVLKQAEKIMSDYMDKILGRPNA